MPSFVRPHFVPRAEWDALRAAGVRAHGDRGPGRAARLRRGRRPALRLPGNARGRGGLGGDRPRRARRGPLAARRLPHARRARASSRSTATPRRLRLRRPHGASSSGSCRSSASFAARARRGLPAVGRGASSRAVLAPDGARRAARARPRIAIVDWAEVKTRADQEILREAFVARGVRCVLADPREMDVRGDGSARRARRRPGLPPRRPLRARRARERGARLPRGLPPRPRAPSSTPCAAGSPRTRRSSRS